MKIKDIPWIKDKIFLALHAWYIGFNPMKDTPQNKLIWVKFPELPIELWTKQVFMDIGNVIGKFFTWVQGVWHLGQEGCLDPD